jgi:hypothetical protein
MGKPDNFHVFTPIAKTTPIPPLGHTTRLAVSADASVTRDNGLIATIVYGGRKISFGPDDREWVTRLVDSCQGRTIGEAARHADLNADDAVDLLQQLYHAGVMENAGDGLIPAAAFCKHIMNATLSFQIRLGDVLAKANVPPSRRITLGRLFDEYHFTLAFAETAGPSIALARNERIRMMWADHFTDEYWHAHWLRRGLNAAGYSDADIIASDPLPGMRAVLCFIQCRAATDELGYAICVSAGENLGMTLEMQTKRYADLIEKGLVDEAVVAPFREHALYDLEQGHNGVVEEVFVDHGPLTRAHQDQLRNTMMMYHHLFFEMELQSLRYYSREDAPIPFRAEYMPRL